MGAAPSYLLPLLQLSDSALPTGAFSHSLGMETHLHQGMVHDEDSFANWLTQFIRIQLVHSDGLAIRFVYEAESPAELFRVDREVHASALPREIREAGVKMGARMLDIARAVFPCEDLEEYAAAVGSGECAGHPALAFAIAGKNLGVPLEELLTTYLFSAVTSLTQNAIRGIPLGQNAGQRVLAAAHREVRDAVALVQELEREDFGITAPGLEIAQMQHERQRARMFMS
ncbi:urease accessory protein [Arthrobacter stackebrandtii]|uniref:Urease accessory protein UreF n=1 Tax=Arthrobacter stackebrandtii TaxID=272161 RepID=A0ABS4Z121_9MICC|nr:urease accessory protein UreF [Arthrobacter stackebrandtii]MBP2414746.1 urease accessory protein [Arthrobacter stackebrandtii]PYG99416.1 urease accessory protein UreF [Arthrobacter stackebrandtii]